ncbi:hypothetical protein D3C80_1332800 [compost metagenome]
MLQIHIIIKSIFNYRTDPKLDLLAPKQAFDSLSHKVSTAVTHNLKTILGIKRNNFNLCSVLQLRIQINRFTVDFTRNCVFTKTAADRCRYVFNSASFFIFSDCAVRQRNRNGHCSFLLNDSFSNNLYCMCPETNKKSPSRKGTSLYTRGSTLIRLIHITEPLIRHYVTVMTRCSLILKNRFGNTATKG